jgi:antirestriction protein ArdC
MPSQFEIQKQINSKIIEGLKNGVVPWRKTWRPDKNSGAPANAISGRCSSGINPILLDLVAMSRGYPKGTTSQDEQDILRTVFRHLKRSGTA